MKRWITLAAGAWLAGSLVRAFRAPGKVIFGCEGRGDGQSPYLTRRTLLSLGPLGKLCLHTFHRSDADVFHDHPFAFATLVLRGGYFDMTPNGFGEWLKPGAFRARTANHTHRVLLRADTSIDELPADATSFPELPATTLVWLGPRVREWGFHLPKGWIPWRQYFADQGCKP